MTLHATLYFIFCVILRKGKKPKLIFLDRVSISFEREWNTKFLPPMETQILGEFNPLCTKNSTGTFVQCQMP